MQRQEVRSVERGDEEIVDVVIVGGGPAGLSAALWMGRYLHSVIVIDSGDPRHWETRGVNGYPGLPEISPAELRGRIRDECREFGARLEDGFVTRVHREGDECFVVEYDPLPVTKAELNGSGPGAPRAPDDNAPRAETRRVVGRRLLLAFGLRDEWPKVPGLQQVYGRTAHVCPDCDGPWTRGRRVAVIGSGRRAVGMALNLTTWTRDIVVCTNGAPDEMDDELCGKLRALSIPVLTEPIACVESDDGATRALVFEDGGRVPCDHIFFSLSQRPADDLAAQLGCERTAQGHVVIDGAYHTSVYNCWAAGDIVPGPQLAVAAAADGAIAALAMHKSLVPAERKLAPKQHERHDHRPQRTLEHHGR
jgi:thioredoxin reductase